MISSIQTDSPVQTNTTALQSSQQSEVTGKTAASTAAPVISAAENTSASTEIMLRHNTDRVEISPEGMAVASVDEATSSFVSPAKTTAATKIDAANNATTSTNLTSLSEQEISKLVQQGTVTQAQANAEIARRAASQQEKMPQAQAQAQVYTADAE